jgi:hypothetical protein
MYEVGCDVDASGTGYLCLHPDAIMNKCNNRLLKLMGLQKPVPNLDRYVTKPIFTRQRRYL